MALSAEEKQEISDALAYGQWSEEVMNTPAWQHVFGVMRQIFTNHVIHASSKREVYAAKARLEATEVIKQTLLGAIAAAKAAQTKRDNAKNPPPGPNPTPMKRGRIQ